MWCLEDYVTGRFGVSKRSLISGKQKAAEDAVKCLSIIGLIPSWALINLGKRRTTTY
jgi:hypothetical protein